MKTIKKTIFLLLLLIGMIGLTSQKATGQVSVSFQMFYDNLSVHGSWINDPAYGYVWSPSVGAGFAPYRSNGYWAYTDYGWTWVSNYSWGWAPFHYGRWFYDPFYGWLWAPDTVWAPAWVTWRYYDGYYGWAPIAPGISIDIAFGNSYSVPYNQWCFVRERDFGRRNISNYYVNASNNTTIIKNSTVINNIQTTNGTRYNAGPGRDHVQKKTGNAIAKLDLKERNTPGQKIGKNDLQLYKPRVERGNAIPSKVTNRKDAKQVTEHKVEPKINTTEKRVQRQTERTMEQPAKQKEALERKAQERQQKIDNREKELKIEEKRIRQVEQREAEELQKQAEKRERQQRNDEQKRVQQVEQNREKAMQKMQERDRRSEQPTQAPRINPQRKQESPQRGNRGIEPIRQNTERLPIGRQR